LWNTPEKGLHDPCRQKKICRKTSHNNHLGKFEEIWPKILHTSQNLLAPTLVRREEAFHLKAVSILPSEVEKKDKIVSAELLLLMAK